MGTRYGPVKLRVPKGFPVLLQKFAKEVLREQPTDIAKFGEAYFKGLLDHKNATGEDPLKGDDDIGLLSGPKNVLRPINSETRQNEIQRESAVTKIQAGYRGYRVRKQSRQEREQKMKVRQDAAATKIQAQYRGYRQRKSLSTPSAPKIDEIPEETAQHTENTDQERNAAIRIQSNFRGYRTRKSLKSMKTEDELTHAPEPPSKPEEESQKMDVAAVKIQASYRGYRTRQNLKKTKETAHHEEGAPEPKPGSVEEEPKPDNDEENQVSEERPEETDTALEPEIDPLQQKDSEEATDAAKATDETVEEEGTVKDDETASREMEAAALKIQASFRGHQTRKQLKEKKEDSTEDEPTIHEDGIGDAKTTENEPDKMEESDAQETEAVHAAGDGDAVAEKQQVGEEAAAVKIQAQYRGYRIRKQMKSRKEPANQLTADAEQEPAQDGEPQE